MEKNEKTNVTKTNNTEITVISEKYSFLIERAGKKKKISVAIKGYQRWSNEVSKSREKTAETKYETQKIPINRF